MSRVDKGGFNLHRCCTSGWRQNQGPWYVVRKLNTANFLQQHSRIIKGGTTIQARLGYINDESELIQLVRMLYINVTINNDVRR
jgi:hypothetical protein